jgi:anaerobic selenocysteine-containing dehydrogenase
VTSVHHSFCRACMNSCPTLVEVDDGRVMRVTGDPSNDIWAGYSCIKGQTQPTLHNHPDRLLHSLKRMPDGSYAQIATADAIGEIAQKLQRLLDEHGPRSVAYYGATMVSQSCLTEPFFGALLAAIGSTMRFSPNTLDKPGKGLAVALHGKWMAPLQGYHDPDVALLIGTNPIKSYYGVPSGHPGKWIRDNLRRGMELLVIDPRRSDVARRASLHLRPAPGHDPEILACLINIVLSEELYDRAFVEENAGGVEALRANVAAFTPETVAARAGVDASDLHEIAVRFATAARGYAVCGVGPGFAKSSTLVEYLTLVLETLCGHWLREGERVVRTPTLLPAGVYKAQACDPTPAWGFGQDMRVGGLTQTVAGLPTGVLAAEMLLEGEGQVRGLISAGGNPVLSWPDQEHTLRGLRSLDLLVQIDPWRSATAREAHYVIAPTMAYETPGMTVLTDFIIAMPTYYGPDQAWSQYTKALVDPPPGSDVIPEWEFVYDLARKMGLKLELKPMSLTPTAAGTAGYLVDMSNRPTAEDLIEVVAQGSRVPLSTVKQHPSGASFAEPVQIVQPKDPGWTGRFDLANGDMMADLRGELTPEIADDEFPFRTITIRSQNQFNSTLNDPATNRGRGYNPAFLHPDDLARLGLQTGDSIRITSRRSHILAVAEADPDLLPGLVALSFGYGGPPERDSEYHTIGSSPGRLLDAWTFADPYVGMPRIGNVPVHISPAP